MSLTRRQQEILELIRHHLGETGYQLTATGRDRLRAGHRCWQEAQRTLSEKLGRTTFDRLIGDLASVTRILSPKQTSKEVTK